MYIILVTLTDLTKENVSSDLMLEKKVMSYNTFV